MFKLREVDIEDIPKINYWRSKRELIDYLGSPFRYINKEVDYKWYEEYMNNRDKNIRCSILDEQDNLVGLVSLTDIDRLNQKANFHIMIGDKKDRGKGIGSYATIEILKHAFLDMNLNRIELLVLKKNLRAINFYKKIGFLEEGTKREVFYKKGEFVDAVVMGILKKDFNRKDF